MARFIIWDCRNVLWGDYLYESQNDDAFYNQLKVSRPKNGIWPVDNEGWVLYNILMEKFIRHVIVIMKRSQ